MLNYRRKASDRRWGCYRLESLHYLLGLCQVYKNKLLEQIEFLGVTNHNPKDIHRLKDSFPWILKWEKNIKIKPVFFWLRRA